MRKTFLITLLLAMISNLVGAQNLSNLVNTSDGYLQMIPGALTKDGNPVLYVVNCDDLGTIESISILDDDLQVVEKFAIPESHDIVEEINFILGEVGPMQIEYGSPVGGGITLVKDIFASGYNYLCWTKNDKGFDVFNSANQKVSSIDFPMGYEEGYFYDYGDLAFLVLGKYKYFIIGNLVKKGSDEDSYTAFYRIDDVNNGVTLVSITPSAKVSPKAPRKGENVTVTLDSELLDKDSMVQVVSASGQTVLDTKIPAGQTQLDINTSGFSKGVYVVTVSADGISKEAAKIIIR